MSAHRKSAGKIKREPDVDATVDVVYHALCSPTSNRSVGSNVLGNGVLGGPKAPAAKMGP
jgi:hypothetical protein